MKGVVSMTFPRFTYIYTIIRLDTSELTRVFTAMLLIIAVTIGYHHVTVEIFSHSGLFMDYLWTLITCVRISVHGHKTCRPHE
jgi:hypothetical protein